MNFIDLLIIAFFGGIVLLSFLGGLGKVLSTLVAFYLAAIVSAYFYQPVQGEIFSRVFPQMPSYTGELTAFLLLMLILTVATAVMLGRNFVIKKLPRWLGVMSNIGGGLLGLAVGVLATILAAMMITILLQVINATSTLGTSAFLVDLRYSLNTSTLVPIFLRLEPTIVTPLRPWFPQGLPPILTPGF